MINKSKVKQGSSASKKAKISFDKVLKSVDFFGEPPMSFDIEGNSTYKSYFGAFLSMIIIIVTASYTQHRFLKMKHYDDSTFQSSTLTELYSRDEPLIYEESQFDFAFGLKPTGGDFDMVAFETEGYIEFRIYLKDWIGDEDGKWIINF